jgi:hypothetical protein
MVNPSLHFVHQFADEHDSQLLEQAVQILLESKKNPPEHIVHDVDVQDKQFNGQDEEHFPDSKV